MLDLYPEIRLVLSDVIPPDGMNGFDLAREACGRKPDLRVLFVSGFVDPAWVVEPRDGVRIKTVTKPFRRMELAAALQAALSSQKQPVAAEGPDDRQRA